MIAQSHVLPCHHLLSCGQVSIDPAAQVDLWRLLEGVQVEMVWRNSDYAQLELVWKGAMALFSIILLIGYALLVRKNDSLDFERTQDTVWVKALLVRRRGQEGRGLDA